MTGVEKNFLKLTLDKSHFITGEQNKADRLIQIEDVKDSGLDREEADLMRQNYAMFEDME